MKPRILIDASTVTAIPDGLSIYIINLLKHFPDVAFAEFDFSVLIQSDLDRPELRQVVEQRPFSVIERAIASIGPRRDLQLRRLLKEFRGRYDLVHSTSNTYPLAMRGGVATVHDVTFKTWFHDLRGIPGTRILPVAYMSHALRHALRRADRIVSVSASTKSEIGRLFRPRPAQLDKVRVVHLGWEHLLDYPATLQAGDPAPPGDYIFFLGSNRVHKNLARLLEAFEQAIPQLPEGKKLVISGSSAKLSPALKQRVDRLNAGGPRVIFTGFLSDAGVRAHYEKADLFIFPSLAEGFGIPILEAFHFGTPLLAARTTSIPEVAGDAALFFDPSDVAAIRDALIRFYAEPDLGPDLAARGRARLKAFSWRKTADETLTIYREALTSAERRR